MLFYIQFLDSKGTPLVFLLLKNGTPFTYKAVMMYKTMNDLAPEYLQSLFSQRHSAYNLRNSEGRLTLSKPSTNYLKRSFSYSGAMLWNNLPKNFKNAATVKHFKRNIKKVADISDSDTAISFSF